jgi:hypothetical protein
VKERSITFESIRMREAHPRVGEREKIFAGEIILIKVFRERRVQRGALSGVGAVGLGAASCSSRDGPKGSGRGCVRVLVGGRVAGGVGCGRNVPSSCPHPTLGVLFLGPPSAGAAVANKCGCRGERSTRREREGLIWFGGRPGEALPTSGGEDGRVGKGNRNSEAGVAHPLSNAKRDDDSGGIFYCTQRGDGWCVSGAEGRGQREGKEDPGVRGCVSFENKIKFRCRR